MRAARGAENWDGTRPLEAARRRPARIVDPLKPVQIAYHVPDPEVSAQLLARRFGWGPFFYVRAHSAVEMPVPRGVRHAVFDHSSAYGQAGEVMVELITQHDDSPSVLRERFDAATVGVHHVARFVPNLPAALAVGTNAGRDRRLRWRHCTASRAPSFAMLDDRRSTLGHMVELYEADGPLLKFYRYVSRAAEGWDGDTAAATAETRTLKD